MQALTFLAKQEIIHTNVPDPELIEPTDVIVKVLRTAVCGSDLHVYHARETGLDAGTVMGHEMVGEIVETGKEVRRFRTGDLVVSPFTTNCGTCFYCQIGLTCRCEQSQLYGWVQNGHGLQGVQAEYARVPLADTTLVKLDSTASLEAALLVGDVRSTGYHCAVQAGIQRDGVYAVVGCGPVGLMAVVAARELGATVVYAIDTVPERLKMAEQFGGIAVNAARTDVETIIKEAGRGRGCDAVLEAVGSESSVRLAYQLLRPGGTISSVGVHTTERFAFSPIEAYDKNVTFKIGRAPARHYMELLLEKNLALPFDIGQLFTHRFALSEGAKAYHIFDKKEDGCIKAVLIP